MERTKRRPDSRIEEVKGHGSKATSPMWFRERYLRRCVARREYEWIAGRMMSGRCTELAAGVDERAEDVKFTTEIERPRTDWPAQSESEWLIPASTLDFTNLAPATTCVEICIRSW